MRRLRVQYASVWAFILLFAAVLIPAAAAAQNDGKAVVKVMTYNANEGTDFLEVLSARDPIELVIAVQTTLNNID